MHGHPRWPCGNDGEDFSVIDAIGGPRGVIESMLPGVVFVVLFVATSNLNLTIAVSAVLAVLQVIVRPDSAPVGNGRGLWSGGGRHLPDLGMAD